MKPWYFLERLELQLFIMNVVEIETPPPHSHSKSQSHSLAPTPLSPSIHHNQRQQSAQLGPRNTEGHSLIVNTVKTGRKKDRVGGAGGRGGAGGQVRGVGDDGMLRA